jgi:hypothetical protein
LDLEAVFQPLALRREVSLEKPEHIISLRLEVVATLKHHGLVADFPRKQHVGISSFTGAMILPFPSHFVNRRVLFAPIARASSLRHFRCVRIRRLTALSVPEAFLSRVFELRRPIAERLHGAASDH